MSVDDSCSIFTNRLIYAFPKEVLSAFLSMVFEVQWRVDSKNDVLHDKRKKTFNLRAGDESKLKRKTWFQFDAATHKNTTQIKKSRTTVAINYKLMAKLRD